MSIDLTVSTCGCSDPELDALRRMVNQGVGQFEASRLLWAAGEWPTGPGPGVAAYVRAHLLARVPWLRLPNRKVC